MSAGAPLYCLERKWTEARARRLWVATTGQGVGMVCGVRGYGLGVVVDAGYDAGALRAGEAGGIDAGGGASGAAEEVDVKEIYLAHVIQERIGG